MTEPTGILHQAQEQVCSVLNNDETLSGKVLFLSENSKDIDYEIKNALGRQGIVGVCMTPDATYQGVNADGEQVWDLRDFTVQVVENPVINRGQPNYANITAQDAVTRAAKVLSSPTIGLFGQYCPTTIEQGEDSGLLVAQARFNVQIREDGDEPSPTIPTTQGVTFRDGVTVHLADFLFSQVDEDIANFFLNSLGYTGEDVDEIAVLTSANIRRGSMPVVKQARKVWVGQNVTSLYTGLFLNAPHLEEVIFIGRTIEEVQTLNNYPWGIDDTSKIKTIN